MTSSAEDSEFFTCTTRITFRGGNVVAVPLASFTKKEDADTFNRERVAMLGQITQGMAMMPNGREAIQVPLVQVLGELGVLQVGVGIEPGELRNSSLVVAKPRIIIPH